MASAKDVHLGENDFSFQARRRRAIEKVFLPDVRRSEQPCLLLASFSAARSAVSGAYCCSVFDFAMSFQIIFRVSALKDGKN